MVQLYSHEMEELITRVYDDVHSDDCTLDHADSLLTQVEMGITNMEQLSQMVTYRNLVYPVNEIQAIHVQLVHAQVTLHEHQLEICQCSASTAVRNIGGRLTRVVYSGLPGRPTLMVNVNQVELLRNAGYTWQDIAQCLQVSRSTLWRRLHEGNLRFDRYTDISDHDLDRIVTTIQDEHPNFGQTLMNGYLVGIGIRVQQYRLRAALTRTNPVQRTLRWHQRLTRRTYSVPGPNALWHIDGHHSLIRWRFVIHGGIDGFSRYIVYLHCSTNNCAETVFNLFRAATRTCGVPSRVRSDRGGENIDVCTYMIGTRGPNRGTHIAASSTHNQRIERLWRDVYRCVASTFYSIFYFMENSNILDTSNEIDMFVLHCVYLPAINRQLHAFVDAWNFHGIRSEHHWSPYRIWLNGVLDPARQGQTAIRDIVGGIPDEGIENFGIDYYGPLPDDCYEEGHNIVEVPETDIPLECYQLEEFLDTISRIPTDNYCIDVFVQARQVLLSMM